MHNHHAVSTKRFAKNRTPLGASSRHRAPTASAASSCSRARGGAKPTSWAASMTPMPSSCCSQARSTSALLTCARQRDACAQGAALGCVRALSESNEVEITARTPLPSKR